MPETPPRYPAMARHRWALGNMRVKCDLADAIAARERFGGRVDRSFVVPYTDGGERLGPWTELLPYLAPPEDGQPWGADETRPPRTASPANPRELPTPPQIGGANHGQDQGQDGGC